MTLASEPEVTLDAGTRASCWMRHAGSASRRRSAARHGDRRPDADGDLGDRNVRFATIELPVHGRPRPTRCRTSPSRGVSTNSSMSLCSACPFPASRRGGSRQSTRSSSRRKAAFPEQLGFVVRDRDLARVRTNYHAQGVLAVGRRVDFAFTPQRRAPRGSRRWGPQPLPSQRVELLHPVTRSRMVAPHVHLAGPLPPFGRGPDARDQTYRRATTRPPGIARRSGRHSRRRAR